jgi:hypothetical protein
LPTAAESARPAGQIPLFIPLTASHIPSHQYTPHCRVNQLTSPRNPSRQQEPPSLIPALLMRTVILHVHIDRIAVPVIIVTVTRTAPIYAFP